MTRGYRQLLGAGVIGAVLTVSALAPPSALGSFPGQNGRIAWDDHEDVYSLNPDGSGTTQLTASPSSDRSPEWSPDGQRILFTSNRDGLGFQVYVMNADGSAQTRLTDPPGGAGDPAWAPDGRRIVFARAGNLWVMDADGTNQTQIAARPGTEWNPDWSPDGSRIAFNYDNWIWSIRPDGTGLREITHQPVGDVIASESPDSSPDGSRLVYIEIASPPPSDISTCRSIHTVRPDGTGDTTVVPTTCEPGGTDVNFYTDPAWSPDGQRIASGDLSVLFTVRVDGSDYAELPGTWSIRTSWQPLPVNTPSSYARPKSANRAQVSLVPTYNACVAPNREHGPPLAFGSCAPPQPGSPNLRVQSDGGPARSTGVFHLQAVPGTPGGDDDTTAELRFNLTNVMRASDLSEYDGELLATAEVRLTDKEGVVSQTGQDFRLEFVVPCVPTAAETDKSSCGLFTSLDAVVPGATPERTRAIWELDQVKVYDGGPDEDADTTADNSLFAVQGVFIP
jgi:WD40-like Beta Propeller Repeat